MSLSDSLEFCLVSHNFLWTKYFCIMMMSTKLDILPYYNGASLLVTGYDVVQVHNAWCIMMQVPLLFFPNKYCSLGSGAFWIKHSMGLPLFLAHIWYHKVCYDRRAHGHQATRCFSCFACVLVPSAWMAASCSDFSHS